MSEFNIILLLVASFVTTTIIITLFLFLTYYRVSKKIYYRTYFINIMQYFESNNLLEIFRNVISVKNGTDIIEQFVEYIESGYKQIQVVESKYTGDEKKDRYTVITKYFEDCNRILDRLERVTMLFDSEKYFLNRFISIQKTDFMRFFMIIKPFIKYLRKSHIKTFSGCEKIFISLEDKDL